MQFVHEDMLHVNVRSETPALYDPTTRNMVAQKKRRLYAQFKRGTAPGYAVELAKQHYGFRKKPAEIEHERWTAFYDSVQDQSEMGWTDEEREAIEAALTSRGDWLVVETPKVPVPYAKYPAHRKIAGKRTIEHVIRDITAAYEATGFDIGAAVAFELQNGADDRVLTLLAGLETAAVEVEPEEQVIAA